MARRPAVPPPRPPNPLRSQREIRAPTPIARKAITNVPKPPKRACPNKECATPKVEDGVCHNCGTIVDDSNIVAEVQFGETSQGAAVVQGSFVGPEQGVAKSLGPAFRRAGGGEDRESTIREGKRLMTALANQLMIQEAIVNSGVQIFKLAAMANFIQGRRMDMVAACCLYSACRKEKPCRVMLIDFADKVQVNVFKLGHTFKALHNTVTLAKDGIQPVLPEDLIYRFAMKLDFKTATNKVAEDAVRMVQRMSLDWMVMGRRPSGVCGACLILAARMNNFRRTVTEVVYVVKVTTHTIQKRLEEFKLTPSSALTVEEFLNNEFLESAHDPPSFYEKQEDFIKNKKSRKRKRKNAEDGNEPEDSEEHARRKKSSSGPDAALPSVEIRRDADGFAIPPQPNRDVPIDPSLVEDAMNGESEASFDQLVSQFGDALDRPQFSDDDEDEDEEDDDDEETGSSKRASNLPIYVPDEWAEDERDLEDQISEMISDPGTEDHAKAYTQACMRANKYMKFLRHTNPPKKINMDAHIGEDEFADDPEVMNCMLNPADVAAKERVWVNENKEWLRKQQVKEYQKRMAADGPPKATRNRKKKPRIGEGQATAASSPAEAAIGVLKARTWSKKINYDAIKGMFPDSDYHGSKLGSATTSRRTSVVGSTVASSAAGSEDEDEEDDGSVAGTEPAASVSAAPGRRGASVPISEASVAETEEEISDWRAGFQKPRPVDDEEIFEDYDEDEYDDPGMGDVEDMEGGMDGFEDDD